MGTSGGAAERLLGACPSALAALGAAGAPATQWVGTPARFSVAFNVVDRHSGIASQVLCVGATAVAFDTVLPSTPVSGMTALILAPGSVVADEPACGANVNAYGGIREPS